MSGAREQNVGAPTFWDLGSIDLECGSLLPLLRCEPGRLLMGWEARLQLEKRRPFEAPFEAQGRQGKQAAALQTVGAPTVFAWEWE